MAYVTLIVKAEEGSEYLTPQAMKNVDDYLKTRTPALMNVASSGLPIQEADGTWKVRVFEPSSSGFVKHIITNYFGLTIVREEEQEERTDKL